MPFSETRYPATRPCDQHAQASMPPPDPRFSTGGWTPPPQQHPYAMGPAPPMMPPTPYRPTTVYPPPPGTYLSLPYSPMFSPTFAGMQPPPPMHAGYALGGAQPQVHMADPYNARAPYDGMAVGAWSAMPPMCAAMSSHPTVPTPQGACPRRLSAQTTSGLADAPTGAKIKKKKRDKSSTLSHDVMADGNHSLPPACETTSAIPSISAPQDACPRQMRGQMAPALADAVNSGEMRGCPIRPGCCGR